MSSDQQADRPDERWPQGVDLPGHVTPGGPSWLLDLGAAQVRKASVSSMDNNVYLVTCTRTGEQLLVDAADEIDRIAELVAEGTDRVDVLVTTHRHHDHVRALTGAVDRWEPRTAAGEADADALPRTPEVRLRDGDTIEVGELSLRAIALRGHTPGSVALALTVEGRPTVLLTGDSLFPGGPGKTGSPTDFSSLMDDLEARVFGAYDDATLVLPGHGDNTTLGAERPQLAAWRARGW